MAADVARSHGLRGALPWQVCPSVARINHAGILKPRFSARKRLSIVNIPRAFFPQAVQDVLVNLGESSPGLSAGLLVNSTVFLVGIQVLLRGLTPGGVVHSWALGTAVYSAFGAGGYVLVCLYFILGSAVTKVKLAQKQKEGIAEARSGRRKPGSVWGSGFAGTLCAVAALATGRLQPWQIGFVASFVSKLSDTVSSEIGKAYGQTTYLITTMQRVPRGTEGAVSAEGTAAGAAAAVLFAGMAVLVGQVAWKEALIVAAAATAANLFESYLGALVQGRVEWLTNDVVNMIQISIAATIAIAAQLVLLK
ncbi:g11919 [Coccomyxa elongata]